MCLSGPKFFEELIDVGNCSPFDRHKSTLNIQKEIEKTFSVSSCLIESLQATINYQIYRVGMFLVHGNCAGVPEFCKILRILYHAKNAYFLCQHYSAIFEDNFGRYRLNSHNIIHIIDWRQLDDFSPLHGYIVNGFLYVVPKRFVEAFEHALSADP